MDLLLDDDGVWSTVKGAGPGHKRSLPIPGGMAPRLVWPAPTGRDLGPWLADRIDTDASSRVKAISRLLATAARATDESAVPLADGTWRPAPGPVAAHALQSAVDDCLTVGLVSTSDPAVTLRRFIDQQATSRIDLPTPEAARSRRAADLWAGHVVARRAANARVALVLGPADHDGWTLSPLVIRIDEPTTRMPLRDASADLFDGTAWEHWREIELAMLRRAWGPDVPDLSAPIHLEPAAVLDVIDRISPRLHDAGFDVIAPGGLLRVARVRRRLSSSGQSSGAFTLDRLGLDAEVLVDGERLTDDEVLALAAAKSELVSVRGRWLRIQPQDAQRLAGLLHRLQRPLTPADLLADPAFEGVEVAADQILPQGLHAARPVPLPPGITATLRPYQHAGLEWLTWLSDNRVGGVLADDMGLGKTLQVLAWIGSESAGPTLVVCPVTLVDTWVRQSEQFAPDLRVAAFHGSDRGCVHDITGADIVITTYGLMARDETLAHVQWHAVVLDEAQAIKNPDTRVARAARALTATHRLVVTGTPVENHVGDLWSLLAFAQPGLLPRRKQFMKTFAEGDEEALNRLRAVVGPFILRRVKTDPGILEDLPDREIVRDDCTLTREQAGAYEAVVADMLGTLETLRTEAAARTPGPEAMGRRAAVLAGIGRLKQICVHPSLLTESRRSLGGRSGKVNRLVDLCGQIVDEGQAVVVFTQFASFVPDLAAHLGAALGVQVATLTGADSRSARAATVSAFSAPDGPPILIASLKAGGTGLTLVRANHVIHLDRWWNPAVEDQASDRVWRIGQNQKVTVHVLVCPGTIEERIDEALSAKRAVASSVVRSTEAAITELSDAELSELVNLVREKVLE